MDRFSHRSPVYMKMGDTYDAHRSNTLQQLLLAHQEQSELQNGFLSGVNPTLLQQFSFSNLQQHNRLQFTCPSTLGFSGVINALPNYYMLQATTLMNIQSTIRQTNRDRLLQEPLKYQQMLLAKNDHVTPEEWLITSNKRDLKSLYHRDLAIPVSLPQDPGTKAHDDHKETADCDQAKIDYDESQNTSKAINTTPSNKIPGNKQDTQWMQSYAELCDYKDEYGDCTVYVPRGFPLNPKLALWVAEQGKQKKLLNDAKNSLITTKQITNEQETKWNEYGDCTAPRDFPLNPKRVSRVAEQGKPKKLLNDGKKSAIPVKRITNKRETKWMQYFNELCDYKDEYGDCTVPRGFALNPKLASWVAEQRKQKKLSKDGKKSSIAAKRIILLEKIGFAWNAQEAAWEKHIDDLTNFKAEFGACLVPLNHPKYPKLGLWVKEQRRHYALLKQSMPSHMTVERLESLNDIGFSWDTHEAVWGERFRELCQYKSLHGDCIVPTNYPQSPKLTTWVYHQRRQYKK